MSTFLPQDSNENPIPALRLKASGAHNIAASGSSARNSVAFNSNTRVISIYADVPVYLKFGGVTVTAANTDHYFPEGVYYDMAIGGGQAAHYTHVAVLRVDGDGDVYISEKE